MNLKSSNLNSFLHYLTNIIKMGKILNICQKPSNVFVSDISFSLFTSIFVLLLLLHWHQTCLILPISQQKNIHCPIIFFKKGGVVEMEPTIHSIHFKSHNSQYLSLELVQDLVTDSLTIYYDLHIMRGQSYQAFISNNEYNVMLNARYHQNILRNLLKSLILYQKEILQQLDWSDLYMIYHES